MAHGLMLRRLTFWYVSLQMCLLATVKSYILVKRSVGMLPFST